MPQRGNGDTNEVGIFEAITLIEGKEDITIDFPEIDGEDDSISTIVEALLSRSIR